MARARAKRRRTSSQTFCERADVYCPRESRPQRFGLEALAVLALLYVSATAFSGPSLPSDARGGSAPPLKPPRKTYPEKGAADGTAER